VHLKEGGSDTTAFQMIGGDRMIGPLGVVVFAFRPTSRESGGDHTTTLRWKNSLPPGLSRIRASPVCHLWHYFIFLPLVQTLGRGPTVWSSWSSSTPPSLGRSRVPLPHYCIVAADVDVDFILTTLVYHFGSTNSYL